MKRILIGCAVLACFGTATRALAGEQPAAQQYENRLTPLANPRPILADHPEFIEPVRELRRFEAPDLVRDPDADLHVRAWRFSYNARGIIEVPNRQIGRAHV